MCMGYGHDHSYVELHESPYLFDMVLDVMGWGIKYQPP